MKIRQLVLQQIRLFRHIFFNNMIEGITKPTATVRNKFGTTLANEPLEIIQNTIIGDPALEQAGGIAIANFVGGNVNVATITTSFEASLMELQFE